MDGTIPFLACNTASGTVQATIPGQGTNVGAFQWNKTCEAPTEESSTFDMWDSAQGLDTVPGFSVQLRPTSVNFAGRIVQESASGTVQDTCHDAIPNNGSAIGVVNPNSIWAVNSTDHYVGDDFVGYFPASVFYYRLQLFRITGNTNFSCGFTVHQQMKMNSPVVQQQFLRPMVAPRVAAQTLYGPLLRLRLLRHSAGMPSPLRLRFRERITPMTAR
jgi:hypothetical protein